MSESEELVNKALVEFAKPDIIRGRFNNPKSFTNWTGVPAPFKVLQWKLLDENNSKIPNEEELNRTLPLTFPEFDLKSDLSATWLGHATVFVHLEGLSFITDPVFAPRASPSRWAGPRRYRKPPCQPTDLPELHVGVISHNHYDHLDIDAVKALSQCHPKMKWFVPMGLKSWMQSVVPFMEVYEKTWGETHEFEMDGKTFTVLCVPAQHWSQRGALDRFKTLWCGWAVMGPNHKFFYTGDTGFCDEEFKKLGDKYGPFQLAAIPIGCYCPRWFMQSQHINPEEAVLIHKYVKAENTMGIHWGTYEMGSNEHYLEPAKLFEEEARKYKYDIKNVFTIGHGKTWTYEKDLEPTV